MKKILTEINKAKYTDAQLFVFCREGNNIISFPDKTVKAVIIIMLVVIIKG